MLRHGFDSLSPTAAITIRKEVRVWKRSVRRACTVLLKRPYALASIQLVPCQASLVMFRASQERLGKEAGRRRTGRVLRGRGRS